MIKSHIILTKSHCCDILLSGVIFTEGINLNKEIHYLGSSLRYFAEGERHVDRFFEHEALLLVFSGTLCFTENGIPYEVGRGEYHIQRGHTHQSGDRESLSPKYLYVHFDAEWTENERIMLPKRGEFNIGEYAEIIRTLDDIGHGDFLLSEENAALYGLLSRLKNDGTELSAAGEIAAYLSAHFADAPSLGELCRIFGYSKNYIIRLMKNEYGCTPVQYINRQRIGRAEYLLSVTGASTDIIAEKCGFPNYSHFYRQFVAANGISPSKWRQIRKKEM